MEVTIRDVAAKAQVSFQLVSAVLGNKSYARASAGTREKIERAASELGYQPNISARILQGGASKLLGVMIDSRAPEETFSLLAELEHAAGCHGYRILIAQAHDDPEKLIDAYYALKQNGVDGIISLAHDYPKQDCRLDQKLKEEKKLVFVRNTHKQQHSFVDVDVAAGIETAVCHLKEQGYRNTALLLFKTDPEKDKNCRSIQERLRGFCRACPEGSVFQVPAFTSETDGLENACRDLIHDEFTEKGIDAVIAQNDYIAAILMKELQSAGRLVPDDFGVVGCDNRLICQCLPVKLTTLNYDRKLVAETTIDFLLKYIGCRKTRLNAVFQPQLIIRESTLKKGRKA